MYFLFFLSIILRLGWLVQDQVITRDIDFYVERSQALVDGQKPYIERADINKPPLFALYIWIIGFSTDVVNNLLSTDITYYTSFRIVSSIGDSLVVIGIFWIAYEYYSKKHAQYAAISYAIFPIAIETSGLSGHYDPICNFMHVSTFEASLARRKITEAGFYLHPIRFFDWFRNSFEILSSSYDTFLLVHNIFMERSDFIFRRFAYCFDFILWHFRNEISWCSQSLPRIPRRNLDGRVDEIICKCFL